MLVIKVSKKVAAIVALAIVALIAGGVALVVSRGDSSSTATVSAAAPLATDVTSPSATPAPASCTSTTTPAAPAGSTSTAVTRRPSLATALADPGPQATPFQRALYATAVHPFWFDVNTNLADTSATGWGATDLSAAANRLQLGANGSNTELMQIGDLLYVDAAQLGSPGSRWVQLDTVTQWSQLPVRSLESAITAMSPGTSLIALASPLDVAFVGDDATGAHYRATVATPNTSFIPLASAFDAADTTTTIIDAWIDGSGHITRISVPIDAASTEFSLHGFGDPTGIATPTDVGDLASTSGTYVFGSGFSSPMQALTVHDVTVAPTWGLVDGIIAGDLHAQSATGEELRATFLGSGAGGKMTIGNVPGQSGPEPLSFSVLPYANWLEGGTKGDEPFMVRVAEVTAADRYLLDLPLFGSLASPVIDRLQADPALSYQLADTIGVRALASVVVDVAALAPGDTPLAFTQKVISFDGTPISVNFFPANLLGAGEVAPTVLSAAAMGEPGTTDPYAMTSGQWAVPGPGRLRVAREPGDAGFNVVTWDARGEFASGGVLQLDNPFFEGRDVSAIIDWVASSTPAELNAPNDPAVGMVGGSYGGGIQLTAAGTEPRIDAIVPVNAWNSLPATLQSGGALDTRAAATLLSKLSRPEIRMSERLRGALLDGLFNGRLSEPDVAVLSNSDVLLGQLQAPTLLIQSTNDPVVPLGQSIANAQAIRANPYGVPTKLIWFDGSTENTNVALYTGEYTKLWLLKYVVGVPIPDAYIPTFQWWDQTGTRFASNLFPFATGFDQPTPLSASSAGGVVTRNGAPIAVSLAVTDGSQIVGAPVVSFTYSGTGSARAVYARLVDVATGQVLGDGPDAIPVVLDGATRTVSVALDDVTYTGVGSGSIRLELLGSSGDFLNSWQGTISVSGLDFTLPVKA